MGVMRNIVDFVTGNRPRREFVDDVVKEQDRRINRALRRHDRAMDEFHEALRALLEDTNEKTRSRHL